MISMMYENKIPTIKIGMGFLITYYVVPPLNLALDISEYNPQNTLNSAEL